MNDHLKMPTVESASKFLPNQSNCHQRVLVVEQECDIRQLNAEVLIDAGYQVDLAEDGAAAWATLQLHRFDLLITDQFLPKVSGVELLKKIHIARMTVPVIMATQILPTWEFALHPCLQRVTMLRMPYTIDKLLGMVKSILPDTANAVTHIPAASAQTTGSAVISFARAL
jgi:two-component system alkaline phosphatase synthesis response regulator PhoP